MPKGLHTQSAVVLFEKLPTRDAMASALAEFHLLRHLAGDENPAGAWMTGRYGLLLGMRQDLNGTAAVQAFDER